MTDVSLPEPPPPTLAEADARRVAAKARLMTTLSEVQERLNPRKLAQGAMESVATTMMVSTVQTVSNRPRTVAAAAGIAALLLFRKPLTRLIAREPEDETDPAPASLKPGAPQLKGSSE